MLPAFADPPGHRKLVSLEKSRLKRHRTRAVDLPVIRKASDKPSDNDPRQHQTEGDALRLRYLSRPAVIRPNPTPSDETGMHGKEKVYGSIP